MSREELVYMSRISEQTERFEDMLDYMKKVVLSLAVVAAMFVSCKEATEKVEATTDSTTAAVENTAGTVIDSTVAAADSTAAKVEGAATDAAAKVEGAAKDAVKDVKEAVKKLNFEE